MLSLSELRVYDVFSTAFLLVKWNLAPTAEDVSTYTFNLYRSTSPADADYVLVTGGLNNVFEYQDSNVDLLRPSIVYYYKLGIVDPFGVETLQSKVATVYTTDPDYVADSIVFSNEKLLEIVNNPPLRLLPRKHTGQECPVCWDPISRNVTKSNCTTCYGTGFTGGYNTPVQIKASFQADATQLGVNDNAILDQKLPTQGWISNYPILVPEDIVVDFRNQRYKILSVSPTTKGNTLLRQIFQLQYLPPTDIAYKFNIS